MIRRILQATLATALVVGLGLGPAPAQAAPLQLEQVLDSVDRSHPKLEQSRRKGEAAEGKAFSAKGGFDPKLKIKSKWVPIGYYENESFDASIQQATPVWGASVYAGYKFGLGNIETYKGELDTLSWGEIRAGIDIPIWNGGPIDERRAKIAQTKAGVQSARAVIDATSLELQRQAANAYWTWVAAGQQLIVAEMLLDLARARQQAIDAQIDAGAVEAIKKVDNQRMVLSRQAKVVSARQKLDKAAVELSLFFRNAEQRPVRPTVEQVPPQIPEPELPTASVLERGIATALDRRPELAALAAAQEMADVGVRLAKNQRAPDASVQAFISKDFGTGDESDFEVLDPVEFGVGVSLTLPIPLRKARGVLIEARAKRAGIKAEVRGTRDKVESEVRKAHVALVAAHRSWDLARREAEAAQTLAVAERRRFDEGASDLIDVNIRELSVASAQSAVIEAAADYRRADADFKVATGTSPL